MSTLQCIPLPYTENVRYYFEPWLNFAWPIWLDSGRPACTSGRYDIISADPRIKLITYGATTEISDILGQRTISNECPFDILTDLQGKYTQSEYTEIPFCSGFLGYFGYDLSRRLEKIPQLALPALNMPDMAIGYYDWAIVIDHHEKTGHLYHLPFHGIDRSIDLQSQIGKRTTQEFSFTCQGELRSNLNYQDYLKRFEQIQQHLYDGDCYQVNFAQMFQQHCLGSRYGLYHEIRRNNPMPFSAYCQYPFVDILSFSPERFVRCQKDHVDTMPIKGTMPRDNDAVKDKQNALILKHSEKDHAENVMIVDLLRNDLSKICQPGSVIVKELCQLQCFSSVYHLVSIIQARMKEEASVFSLLKSLFPGGSITGAPKLSAMRVIEQLEPNRRHLFCGAIGYINHVGYMDTSIAIRTLAADKASCFLWAGGGIVADSNPAAEYQETLDKVRYIANILTRGVHENN